MCIVVKVTITIERRDCELKKIVVGTVIGILAIIGVVLGINEYNYLELPKAYASNLSLYENSLAELDADLSNQYVDDTNEFIKSDVTKDKLEDFSNRVLEIENDNSDLEKSFQKLRTAEKETYQDSTKDEQVNAVKKTLTDIQNKFEITNQLNALFQNNYLSDDKVNNETIIADDLTKEDVENVKKEDDSEELKENKETTSFYGAVYNGIVLAEEQVNQIEKAKEVVGALYSNEKVSDQVTRTSYETAKKEVEAVKNETAKKSFELALKAMDEKLTKEEMIASENEKKNAQAEKSKQQSQDSTTENTELVSNDNQSNTTPKTTSQTSDKSSDDTASEASQAETETGLAKYIANSPTAKKSNQILGVVGSGSNAKVHLFEKSNGVWKVVLTANGRVGYNGVGNSYEGSGMTPKGSYQLSMTFGKGANPGTKLPYRQITDNSYWISNTSDPQYNTWQERSSSSEKDEHLIDYAQYKYGIVMEYNKGIGGGSAFFVHLNGRGATAGCVSVDEATLLTLMKRINSGAYIMNVNSESELANY